VSEIIVIYDGQCGLCKNSILWVSNKLEINAIDFHTADLAQYGLSAEQCSREVFVITGQQRFSGARAAAFLLECRGNKVMSALVKISGPLGRVVYRWVAGHRNSWPVKILSRLLKPR
jgi:predicted DCC family thiol-disulfide oxidoreductase YuxK